MNSSLKLLSAFRSDSAGTRDSRWLYALVGITAAFFFFVHLFHFPAMPIWHGGDQRIPLEHAERMMHGEVLYRDLFQFNLPGTEYLYYFLFRCFGVLLSIPSLVMLATLTAITLLVYSLSRTVLNGLAALLSAVAFMVVCLHLEFDATHHWYSTLFVLIAVNLVARAGGQVLIAWAGVSLGLATLFTSSRGVFVALGVSLFFVWRHRSFRKASRNIVTLLVPMFLVVGSVLVYCAITAGFKTVFDSVVVFPLRYYPAPPGNHFSVYFLELNQAVQLQSNPIALVLMWLATNLAIPLVFVAFIAMRFRGRREDLRESPRDQTLILLAFAGAFAFLAIASAPSGPRLYCAGAFAYILAVVMLQKMRPRWIGAAMVAVIIPGIADVALSFVRPFGILQTPRGTVAILNSQGFERYDWIARHSCAGDQMIPGSNYSFVLGLRNPSKINVLSTNAYTRPELVRDLMTVLHNQPVRFLIWEEGVLDTPDPGNSLHPFFVYKKDHYRLAQQFRDGTEILVDDSAPAHCQLQEIDQGGQ